MNASFSEAPPECTAEDPTVRKNKQAARMANTMTICSMVCDINVFRDSACQRICSCAVFEFQVSVVSSVRDANIEFFYIYN